MRSGFRCAVALLSILVAVPFGGCSKKASLSGSPNVPLPSSNPAATLAGTGNDPSRAAVPGTSSTEAGQGRTSATEIPLIEVPEMRFVEPTAAEKAILKSIYFEYDKTIIRPEFRTVLEKIATWLHANPDRQLMVEGHCDERGTEEYNLALGEKRALAVRFYLANLGVAPTRLHTVSYGEEKPAVGGHDERAWSKNRRAAFLVSMPREEPRSVSFLEFKTKD